MRGGPGWWLDPDGVWRSPEDWPEDTPPIDGWVRQTNGVWKAPKVLGDTDQPRIFPNTIASDRASAEDTNVVEKNATTRSRQAEADRKAIFTVAGVIAAALVLLVAALVFITQAGAEEDVVEQDPAAAVVFAAETDELKMERRAAAAAVAPDIAQEQLAALVVRSADSDSDSLNGFDLIEWTAERTECLDIAEQALIARSQSPIEFADQLECVPDRGRWHDRYLNSTISRTLDADVTLHVPAAVAYVSGGADWAPTTLQAFLTDLDHPATLQITTARSGHNPRGQDPSAWKPSSQSTWCAYAIDWIFVKTRWDLSIHGNEQLALADMLDTCGDPDSAGPDLLTMVIEDIASPTIERVDGVAE